MFLEILCLTPLFIFVNSASEGDIQDLNQKIIINDSKLPGIKVYGGKRCIQKVFFEVETRYDRGMDCYHKLKEKCHLTYVTNFQSEAEKKCETTFKKSCFIAFKSVPHTEKVKKCHSPSEKKCGDDIQGPEVCKTQYEDHCETKYKTYEIEQDEPNCRLVEELRCKNVTMGLFLTPVEEGEPGFAVQEKCEKWPIQKCRLEKRKVKKVHPETECNKIPRTVCTPSNCKTVNGPEICREENITQIQKVPKEECNIEPQENCSTESTLVPKLIAKKNCAMVPQEVCVRSKNFPRKIARPVIKKWCYKPDELKEQAAN